MSSTPSLLVEHNGTGMSATATLLTEPIRLVSTSLEEEESKWHYAMVFPLITDESKTDWAEPMEQPVRWAEEIFTGLDGTGHKNEINRFVDGMSKADFHGAVRNELVSILRGKHCGFSLGTRLTIDEDEVILKIALSSQEVQKQLAHSEGYRMQLKAESYPPGQCPTALYSGGSFQTATESGPYGVKDNSLPAHVAYASERHGLVAEFRDVDLLRLSRRRMLAYFNSDKLMESGVALQVFPIHEYASLAKLYEAGWSNPAATCQFPGQLHSDFVRSYFGEEVAFFFHWLNFFNRYMIFAGGLGLLIFALSVASPGEGYNSYVKVGFSVFMCIWGSVYTKAYKRRANLKIYEWGMKAYTEAASVRRGYVASYRGTFREKVQYKLHWLLAFSFIAETLVVVWLNSALIVHCNSHLDEVVYFGMTGKSVKSVSRLMITANIKIVDNIWKRLSPYLTNKENWRTDQECKQAKIVKLFTVKFFVYYYPFWYISFIKEYISGVSADVCLEELESQIYTFFPIETISVFAGVGLPMFMTWWTVRREIAEARKLKPDKIYSYIEFQAKCPPYADDIEDMMSLILAFGFLMMFSVILPLMPTIAVVSHMVQIRLLAYRLSFSNQRATPRGQEGIGSWGEIVQLITFVGVFTNVALAVFMMKPLRDEPLSTRCLYFLFLEHAMLLIKLMIMFLVPDTADAQKMVEEHNTKAVEQVLWPTLKQDCADLCNTSANVNLSLDKTKLSTEASGFP